VSPKSKSNLVAYGILSSACLTVAFIAASRPELFAHGPPSFRLFLSIRGTAVILLLGLIGILFLNRSTLRGLWDGDLTARQKVLMPLATGIVLGGVHLLLRLVIPIDAAIAAFVQSQGLERIAPSLAGAILGYFSGGILINILYFLILIPPVVYLVSDRLLKGQRQAIVFWSIAALLALWEPLTNPPLAFSIERFGALGALVLVVFGFLFCGVQAWFMRAFGFVALVFVRIGLYAVTHVLYPRLSGR
jgi:hypothetical protein